jgi:hypothetical protein
MSDRRLTPVSAAAEGRGWMPKLRGHHLDEFTLRTWRWDGEAILLQALDVKFDGFADQP